MHKVQVLCFRLVPAHLTDHVEEIGCTCKGTAFLLDKGSEVGWEDLDHGLGGQLVHAVVLVVASGQVSEHVPGQLVDALDDLSHVSLEVSGGQQSLQFLQFLVRDLPLPFKLATALGNHVPEGGVSLHELLEGLGESLGSNLSHVHGEHNQVEVSLNVVHDLVLEVGLPVVAGHVEGHLGLDDALADVFDAGAAWRGSGQVDQFVDLGLGDLGVGVGGQQLFDDLEFAHLHGFLSSCTSMSMPGRPSFFFLRASRMSSGTMPLILSSSLTRAPQTMAVVVLLMPAWQLKMTGQEAVVSFSIATIWSKFSSAGACSWFMGILMGSSLGTLSLMAA